MSLIAGLALAAWALHLSGRPFVIRNESGRAVELVLVGTTSDRIEAVVPVSKQTPVIRLANGERTELKYDFQSVNLCWLVVSEEGGDARVVKTPLTRSAPNACSIEAEEARPCCSPLPRGLEFVIPLPSELEPAPPEILKAANLPRKP
ncbi:hypothetical protein [Corallococcus sp. AB011P]|uniref:hypothetical protein n=1 Tax=Corallococcus sp. AB011P TaxID=2316735 RepID=UPI0011C41E95|nr:hypothetical protein [Corallococcus sp. AB011P]